MRVALFSVRAFEQPFLEQANREHGHELVLHEAALDRSTVALAAGFPAVAAFASDRLDREVLQFLRDGGTRLVALRSAGFNHVDLRSADELGLVVARVPAYSPHAIAEHAVGLILVLNRKLHRAYARVRELNFSIEGLMGFDLFGKTAGIVGTGRIGAVAARILAGFGCRILAHDPVVDPGLVADGVRYLPLDELLAESHVVSLHCPLTPQTRHLIDARALGLMRQGALLINTSRGSVIDTRALIACLKTRRLGGVGLDVYEEEEGKFFRDLSEEGLQDDVLARLLTFPNVFVTAHQGFFTREAVRNIAETTLANVTAFERGGVDLANLLTGALVVG